MSSEILVQVGRVVLITSGNDVNKLAVIIDILNQNNVLISNPLAGVSRQLIHTNKIRLTKFRVSTVLRNQRESKLAKKIEEYKLSEKFAETQLGKTIKKTELRKNLTDLDRFKVMVLKRQMNSKIRAHINKNKKSLSK